LPEFALVLPVFILIMLIAVDFGRLFGSWVAIHNAARIAANYAAAAPTASFGAGSDYETTVRNESNTSGCNLPSVSGPVFTPNTNVGSTGTVALTCRFTLLTPFIGAIVGNPLKLSASSQFMIRGGTITGIPNPTAQPCDATHFAVPNLVGLKVSVARSAWTAAGFSGSFIPGSGHNAQIVTGQVPDVGACRLTTQTMVVTYS